MDCLFDTVQNGRCFFEERIVSRENPQTVYYRADVTRKSDPLLILFMNNLSSVELDGCHIPPIFSRMLHLFQNDRRIQAVWHEGALNTASIFHWFSSGVWIDNLAEEETVSLFFLASILEAALKPIFEIEKKNAIQSQQMINSIMSTSWRQSQIDIADRSANPLRPYFQYLRATLLEYSALWHFINHQATTRIDDSYGLFPEKKVRLFCKSCLGFSLDSNENNSFEMLFNQSMECQNIFGGGPKDNQEQRLFPEYTSDPKAFFSQFDEAYSRYLENGDCFHAGSLTEIICLSLLHFSIRSVPIRRCSLCQRFYIPTKNQSGEMNYCHRDYTTGAHQSCSSYHSHNQRFTLSSSTSTQTQALDKRINTLRSTFAQSAVSDWPNGRSWMDFLRDSVTIVSRAAKKDARSFIKCSSILDRVRLLHQTLKRIGRCPEKTVDPLNTKTDMLQTVEAKLQSAETIVASILEEQPGN